MGRNHFVYSGILKARASAPNPRSPFTLHRVDQTPKRYFCIYCGKSFRKGRQVLGHVVGKHMGKSRLRETTISVSDLNAAQKGYPAAFLDGEGGIQITRSLRKGRQYRVSLHPVVYFTNTNLEVIQTIRNWLRAGSVVLSRQRKGYRNLHVLHITGIRNISRLLRTLCPYLVVKRERADLLLAFCKSRRSPRGPEGRRFNNEELRLYSALKKANLRHRGTRSRQRTGRSRKLEKSGPRLRS
jgi:hypothetical protein